MEETDRRLKCVLKSVRQAISSQSSACRWTAVTPALDGREMLLLTADGEDAAEVATTVQDGLVRASKVLQSLAGRVGTLVRSRWPRIVIVPLLRRRPLGREGIIVDTLVAASPGWAPEWWHLMSTPLETAYFDVAGLVPWELPALDLGRSLVASSSALLAIVRHLLDLPTRADLDDLGREILARHLAQMVSSLRAGTQAVTDAVAATEDWMAQHSTEAPSAHSEALSAALHGIRHALGRPGDLEEPVDDLAELAACVTEVQRLSVSAYFALASDAVGQTSEGSTRRWPRRREAPR
jgi:hypothetical protein